MCWVCNKRTKWFYENILLVRTKHSEKLISAIMKLILGEEYAAVWCLNKPAAICFKCVDRYNQYDEAYEELQKMKEEMKSMLCANIISKHADAYMNNTPTNNVITDASEAHAEEIDVDKPINDSILDNLNRRTNIEAAESPQSNREDSIVQRIKVAKEPVAEEPVAEEPVAKEPGATKPTSNKIPIESETMDFYCEECKRSFRKKQGLMVR